MAPYRLLIGNRNYSSWSLRAGLYVALARIDAEIERIAMFTEGWRERVLSVSPTGRVPALVHGDTVVWDSLAIILYLHERHGDAPGWPSDRGLKGMALSVVAEMHSGFAALRAEMPQNLKARLPLDEASLSRSCRADVERVRSLLDTALQRSGGPWLFGELGIADVVYAPTILRFVTYGISPGAGASDWLAALQQLPALREWCAAAEAETERLDFIDDRTDIADTPLSLG